MALPPGGADLEGGRNEARNAEVAALKRLFYTAELPGEPHADTGDAEADAQALGVHLNLPLARWSQPFLPHQQVLLNIFQPEYTHMFETLVASPKPWLYMHVSLPGGRDNIANPQYALPEATQPGAAAGPPSLAPLAGTLMQVVDYARLDDARLRVVVQGLGRAVIVHATQARPFARATVQWLPDSEALLASARLNRRWLLERRIDGGEDEGDGTAIGMGEGGRALRRRMVIGAAAAEDACWRPYEFRAYTLRSQVLPPAFASYDPTEATTAAAGEASSMSRGMRAVPVSSPPDAQTDDRLAGVHEANEAVRVALMEAVVMAPVDVGDADAAAGAAPKELAAALEAAREEDEEEAAAEAQELAALETQVWLELDALLRGIAALGGASDDGMPAPTQLLGLLPPAPQGGWPASFALTRIVAGLQTEDATIRQRAYASARELIVDDDPEPYEPLDARYPPRRRAQRLSYAIWSVIATYWEGLELQPALEAESTSDRLRLALLRLRVLQDRLEQLGV